MSRVDPDRFLLRRDRAVQAGAGTGKTHALVTQHLHLCLGLTAHERALEPRAVLALTFTDKAAGEMLERLRRRVRLLCQAAARGAEALALVEPDLCQSAAVLGRPLPEAAACERLLGQLSLAPVSTFHAFAGNLLRRHAALCGLEPDFTLLDEESARELQIDATERVVLQALDGELAGGEEPISADDAARLLAEYGFRAPGEGEALVELLCAVRARRAEEGRSPAGLADGYRAPRLVAARAAQGAQILNALWQIIGLAEVLGPRSAAEARGLQGAFAALQPLLVQPHTLPQAVVALGEVCEVLKRLRARPGDAGPRERLALLKAILRESLGALAALSRTAEAAPLALTFERLCAAAERGYAEQKQRQGALDFADLLGKARDLLRDHPDERERVRGRFQAVLVDEFQDTNPLQAELLELLVGEPGSHQPGRLYIVGDRKQSIYEFRGADVATFARWCQRIVAAGGDEEHLRVSRRSQPGVLRLVNALFAQVMGPAQIQAQALQLPAAADGGVVVPEWIVRWQEERDALLPLRQGEVGAPSAELLTRAAAPRHLPGVAEEDDEEEREEEREEEADPAPLGRPGSAVDREAELCARHILNLHREGRPYGDVAMLLRRFTHLSRYLAALRRARIPHYVVKGRGFFDAAEIRDVNAALTLLDDPEDAFALVTLLRSPLCALADESLVRLHLRGRLRLPLLLQPAADEGLPADQAERLRHTLGWLGLLLQHGERLGPLGALRVIYDHSDLQTVLAAGEGGAQRIANLELLLGRARAFEDAGGGLRGFIRWLRGQYDLSSSPQGGDGAQAQLVDEHGDVVRVMTVHQAKGLEFPVVLIPGCQARERADTSAVAYDPEVGLGLALRRDGERVETLPSLQVRALRRLRAQAESARLLYVAATRARDRVIFSGDGRRRAGGEGEPGEDGEERGAGRRRSAAPRAAATWRAHLDLLREGSDAGLLTVVDPLAAPALEEPAALVDERALLAEVPPLRPAELEQLLRQAYPSAPVPSGAQVPLRLSCAAATDLLVCPRRYHLRHGLRLSEGGAEAADPSGRRPAREGSARAYAAEEDREATPRERVQHGTLAHWLLAQVPLGAAAEPADAQPLPLVGLDDSLELEALLLEAGYDPSVTAVAEIRTRVGRLLRTRLFQELAAQRPAPLRALPYALRLPSVVAEEERAPLALVLEGELDLLSLAPAGGAAPGGGDALLLDYHYGYQPRGEALAQIRRGLLGLVGRALWPALRPQGGDAPVLRVGLLYLREPDPTPHLHTSQPEDEQALAARLLALAPHALRPASRFTQLPQISGLPADTCAALECGYVGRCHPASAAAAAADRESRSGAVVVERGEPPERRAAEPPRRARA